MVRPALTPACRDTMPHPTNQSSSASSSRRQFLSRTAVGATALALPTVIPRHVLGDDRVASANERVNVGYIGCGRRSNQLRGLPADAQIVAVADCNLPRAEADAARYKCKSFQDYRKMLEMADLDAVVVATPDHWHTLPSIHACMAGKDVYVEKPMTLTIREGRQLTNAARKYKRIVQCGSQQRSTNVNVLACRLVREGAIGKILRAEAANFESPWSCNLPSQPVPTGIDWDMWLGQSQPQPYHEDIYRPRAKPGWISFRRWSGGEMTGWGAHGLDQIQSALGMENSGPVEIWTEGKPFAPPTWTEPISRGIGDKQCSSPIVMMKYANGVELKFSGGARGGGTFYGEKGTIWIDRGRLKADPADILLPYKDEMRQDKDPTQKHLANWIDCIKSRERSVADVEIGHRSATLCHLGNIARWVGSKLTWDPVAEQFKEKEANQFVQREQRAGYEIPDV